MFDARHLNEFLRAFRNHQYEVSPKGLFFPKQKAIVGGIGQMSLNHGPWDVSDNIVVTQGQNYLLAAGLAGGTAATTWYIAPFVQNVAPTLALTAANFNATLTEFTNYDESARQQWVQAGAASGSISNVASPAEITIAGGVQDDVYGMGLLSVAAKSSGSGTCMAAILATAPKLNMTDGDTLGFKYTITTTST